MKIVLLILIFLQIDCQEDKFVKLVLSTSASGILAGGVYGSIVLLDETTNFGVSKIKSLNDVQKYCLKKSLIAAGSYGLSKSLGFSNEGAMTIAGSSIISELITSKFKSINTNNYNVGAYSSALAAGIISSVALYRLLDNQHN